MNKIFNRLQETFNCITSKRRLYINVSHRSLGYCTSKYISLKGTTQPKVVIYRNRYI